MDVITVMVGMLWWSPTSSKLDVTNSFNFYQYDRSKISNCVLNFYFFNCQGSWHFFSYVLWIFVFLHWLIIYSYFLPVFLLGCLSLPGWLIEPLYISRILILCLLHVLQMFCLGLPFCLQQFIFMASFTIRKFKIFR